MTTPALGILYRGSLTSCNYRCSYCPFAKRHETRAERERDRVLVERFVEWVGRQGLRRLSILVTPWGEALVRRWYRDALVALSHVSHVDTVGVQTNLSARLDWLGRADLRKVRLWTTFHPTQVEREAFLERCLELRRLGVRFSVGVVGMPDALDHAEALKHELGPDTYVWINAVKRGGCVYDDETLARFAAVDPLFELNRRDHPSRGKACATGERVIAVRGDGTVQRCWFVRQVLGNLFEDDLESMLRPRPCPVGLCGCHLGYVHLEHLRLADRFGSGLLQRVPDDPSAIARWRG